MIKNKTLKQWTDLIESFHPNEIELGLERITEVAQKLDLLSFEAKVVIVGGTNGKGSCVATLESYALNSKLKVGCYTSPHLQKFNERIRVNGVDVSDELLIEAFETVDLVRCELALTFFEFTTLVALTIFKQAKLNLIVLEVGLGGRLDAVNIVEPNATIISTVALDHEAWLGNDLKDIAYEKSGICRKNSFNLVGDKPSFDLVKQARPDLKICLANMAAFDDGKLLKLVSDPQINPNKLLLQNVLLASQVFNKLFERAFASLNLKNVIQSINLRGRFFKLSNNPLVIADVGHNVQAAKNLCKQIKESDCKGKRVAICGLMADKAISEFISVMNGVIDEWYFVDLPSDRAAISCDLLTSFKMLNSDKNAKSIESVSGAYEELLANIGAIDEVYIFGSFITVAEVLHYFQKNC